MSLLESQRLQHATLHRLEQEITTILSEQTTQHKSAVVDNHRVARCLEDMARINEDLALTYQNPSRKRAIEDVNVDADDLSMFYSKLKNIKETHRSAPISYLQMHLDVDILQRTKEQVAEDLALTFSGEEMFGKYLDLTTHHHEFLNIAHKPLSYRDYISSIDDFSLLKTPSLSYLGALKAYLESFFQRALPLFDFIALKTRLIDVFNASETLAKLESDLYCAACQKTFTNKTVFEAHKTGKKHLKASVDQKPNDTARLVGMYQALIKGYMIELAVTREDTKSFVDTKQLLTEKERSNLIEEAIEEPEAPKEDQEETLYNPLKLPLGWDGKPIPYWLFKLHGLGIEYNCEICGNFSYMGRKAFDKHFNEWRHAHGMKCLGIPNTPHFHDITTIKDAYALWEGIKGEKDGQDFKGEIMEECEDGQGNVLNRKTFDDLTRQGLI